MEPLIKGIISGITVSFMIGPIFFALMELTISKGWRCGFFYVLGVLISDVVLIYAVETILVQFPFDNIKSHIGLVGGILLIVFGLVTFFAKASMQSADITNIKTLFQSFFKGVTINVLNPFVTIWWITMYTTISINYISISNKILFYFGILLMVFLFDLLKMRFAYYLKQNLTLDKLLIVKKIAGICLFVFGVVMIVKVGF
ncbi:MAG: LysE family transporter [Saprospirales bacterium]|nr:LysE family transporter [Saprospirales bacterium]